MGTYAPFVPCQAPRSCYLQLLQKDMAAHVQWHADLNANNNLIKVLLPGLSLTLL